MKKLTAALLVLALASAMAGCGAPARPQPPDSRPMLIASAPEPIRGETPPEPAASSAASEGEAEIARGAWHDNTYSNPSADITFVMPGGWSPVSVASAQQPRGGGSSAAAEGDGAALPQGVTVELNAVENSTGNNILVVLYTADEEAAPACEDDYLALVQRHLEQAQKIHYTCGEACDMYIGGNLFRCLPFTAEYNGAALRQYACARRLNGTTTVCITVTVNNDASPESVLAAFI